MNTLSHLGNNRTRSHRSPLASCHGISSICSKPGSRPFRLNPTQSDLRKRFFFRFEVKSCAGPDAFRRIRTPTDGYRRLFHTNFRPLIPNIRIPHSEIENPTSTPKIQPSPSQSNMHSSLSLHHAPPSLCALGRNFRPSACLAKRTRVESAQLVEVSL
jgi:hypothetical protein